VDDLVARLRAVVLAGEPALVESVKWNAPNFSYDGIDRVTMRIPPRGGMQLVFHRGAALRQDAQTFSFDDPSGLLDWRAPDRGVLSIGDAEELERHADVISDLVRRWVRA
jgi:hypothetical protein